MTKQLTAEQKAKHKADKAQSKPPKAEKPPKAVKTVPTAMKAATKTAKASLPDDLELLRTKLRRKYALLKTVDLAFSNRDSLLKQVCTVLGMTRPELDWVLKDL